MNTKNLKKIEYKLNKIGGKLYTLESLSKILLNCLYENYDLKQGEIQCLGEVLRKNVNHTRKLFREIIQKLGI